MTLYKGYNISYDCPPVPVNWMDYRFTMEGCEGELADGHGSSIEDCKAQIDEMEDDRIIYMPPKERQKLQRQASRNLMAMVDDITNKPTE